jgi:hypothetical protein
MATVANPYGDRRSRAGEAPGVNTGSGVYYTRYAVPSPPDSTDEGYGAEVGTQLRPVYGSGNTPDLIRTGQQEPPYNDPNVRVYTDRRTREFHERHSVEQTDVGWHSKQERVPPGQNPLWEQERMHTRPSATRDPLGYRFTRPWHVPRFLHDIDPSQTPHISMADHRRQYEIYGMRSRDRTGVNTFRLDPVPWDQGLYPPGQLETAEPSEGPTRAGNRSYRFDG